MPEKEAGLRLTGEMGLDIGDQGGGGQGLPFRPTATRNRA